MDGPLPNINFMIICLFHLNVNEENLYMSLDGELPKTVNDWVLPKCVAKNWSLKVKTYV